MKFFFSTPSSFRTSRTSWASTALLLLAGSKCVAAISLNLDDPASIKSAASTIARGMLKFYHGNETGGIPGKLPDPYYWWEAGAMFGALIDYWHYTGDTSFNAITTEALLFQVGPDINYMPPNETKTLGNDDQSFWGMAAMSAAEHNYPNPPADQPQWLALAQAVFNSQAFVWDTATCGGGLKWQKYTFNNGYNYKNSISNGAFFNLGARLAKYTNNQTYADWAEKAWDWTAAVKLLTPDYRVFDGTDDTKNCTTINRGQWSYNVAIFLFGAANMYNYTNGSEIWRHRVEGLLNATDDFFDPNVTDVMYEAACEPYNTCNTDQLSFKAYLSRWMAGTTQLAPFTFDVINRKLRVSALAAAKQCSGGSDGVTCGAKWMDGTTWDGTTGVGQQMSALEVIQGNLIIKVAAPLTNTTGGTSQGNPSAGSGPSSTSPSGQYIVPIKQADKVGAGFLTGLAMFLISSTLWFMVS